MIFTYPKDYKREYNQEIFERNLFNLKYGNYMSILTFPFIESILPQDNFNKLPLIPITIADENKNQELIYGIIDTGSTNTFIDKSIANKINLRFIDTLTTIGVNSTIENIPVSNVYITNETMDKKWLNINVGIIDTKHSNIQIVLGRDFLDQFNQIVYDGKNKIITLDF